MPNTILVSPYEAWTTIKIWSAAVRHIRMTSLNNLFSAVGFQKDFLRVWGGGEFRRTKSSLCIQPVRLKWSFLKANDSRNIRGIPWGGMRPKSAYNRRIIGGHYCSEQLIFSWNGAFSWRLLLKDTTAFTYTDDQILTNQLRNSKTCLMFEARSKF